MTDKDGKFNKPERGSSPLPDHIMLSFWSDAKTSAAISWRTDENSGDSYILYRREGSADLMRQEAVTRFAETDIDRSNYHWVRLSGLEPGCKYCYTVGDDEHRSGEFTFAPSSAVSDDASAKDEYSEFEI